MARKGDGLRKRGDTWYLDARINGERHTSRLGKLISRSVAAELAIAKRQEILKLGAGHAPKRRKPSLTFEEGKVLFLAWCETNTRPHTLDSYRQCLKQLSETFAGKRLSEIHPFTVEAYKSARARKGAKTRCNHELRTLRAMFNRLAALKKHEGANPVRGIGFLEESKGKLRFLDEAEEQQLLEAAGEPLRTILITAIYSGLRLRSELLSLTWGSVDFRTNHVTVEGAYAKNGETRSVPMNSVLREALVEHRKRAGEVAAGDRVFTATKGPRKGMPLRSVRTSLETAAAKAKLKGVSPHTLRHTFASKLVMSGCDLRTVQELGGWSSLELVQRYAHLTPEHRRDAVERMVAGNHFTSGFRQAESAIR